MSIHQIQVRYESTADRVLLQLRTANAELYAVWLTRRMLTRLYPPFRQAVAQASVAQATPGALPVPEARQMLEQAALQRPLQGANFGQPFTTTDASWPLGTEPLLPDAADLRPGAQGQLTLALREPRGRRIEMLLNTELSAAMLRLLDGALAAAEWGIATGGHVDGSAPSPDADPDADAAAGGDGALPGRLLS